MMGVDATTRAEVMLCGVGVELVKREQFAAPSNVDAIQIRGHRNRPAHATVRTRTTPRRTKPIGQPCSETHPTAMAEPLIGSMAAFIRGSLFGMPMDDY